MSLWDQVIEDMRQREEMGHRKYGKLLDVGDGRDFLVEAFEEALDQVVYLKAAIVERDKQRSRDALPGPDSW